MAINFEKTHNTFDGMMLDLCVECGGACEKNEISTFLPGEMEYVAEKIGVKKTDFVKKYCSVIKYKGHNIYILKAGVCPFLDSEYRCELEPPNCKLIRCMLYPAIIRADNGKKRILLDDVGCPMAHRTTEEFQRKAFKAYEDIKKDIPMWWLEFVSKYDELYYDYDKLSKLRDRKTISMKDLDACIKPMECGDCSSCCGECCK